MHKKVFIFIFVFLTILLKAVCVNADDEIDEISVSQNDIKNIVEAATDVTKIPTINSRYAVVYDRISRKHLIWKTRKQKVQDGLYNKNNDFDYSIRKCKGFK